jgi:hypothetical protein
VSSILSERIAKGQQGYALGMDFRAKCEQLQVVEGNRLINKARAELFGEIV